MEKLVEAGLEIPRFSTLDAMASTVRARVTAFVDRTHGNRFAIAAVIASGVCS